jgi:hypothetical protein
MMFLLKAAFWLGLVLVLLPTGSNKRAAEGPQISAADAASAATAAVGDLSRFCTRQPESCTVGSNAATILAQRAQDGAAMVYEYMTERREAPAEKKHEVVPGRPKAIADARAPERSDATGSLLPRPRPARGQDTLTASDRHAAWRQPDLRQEAQLRAAGK